MSRARPYGFDTKRFDTWVWNSNQTVPYNDGGNNVVRSNGTTVDWQGNLARTGYTLTDGNSVRLRFKVDATNTEAHFSVETAETAYKRFGVIASGGTLYVQYTTDGLNWQFPKTLLSTLAINTWYVVQLSLDDHVGFTAQVYQESNPANSNMYSIAMPAGQNWRFHHWVYRNSAFLDDYQEFSGALYRYDEPGVPYGVGRMTSKHGYCQRDDTLAV